MSHQRHVIHKQILEIHLYEGADVQGVQTLQDDIISLYHQKLVPIINRLCDRYSADGTQYKIEELTIDLGNIRLKEFDEVFAQKFEEMIRSQKSEVLSGTPAKADEALVQKTPVEVLSYYLMTGTLPWWMELPTKDYLYKLLDALSKSPNTIFKALIRQVGQKKTYRNRFLYTFSEEQIQKSLQTLTSFSLDQVFKIKQEITDVALSNPERFSPGITAQKVANSFWSAVFAHATTTTVHSNLMRDSIYQTLQVLGADLPQVLNDIRKKHPSSSFLKRIDPKIISRAIDASIAQNKSTEQLARSQGKKPLEGLGTIKREPERETELNQEPSPTLNIMEMLHSTFNDTDFITVQNAGLVILWPFMQRFFENLQLLNGKAFSSEFLQNKAVYALHYVADEEEEGVFEGQLTLNKVLCGIQLSDPVSPEPLSAEDREIAKGMLQAVIAWGPHWKNLSLSGFRTSYLKREGLLSSRDGHWHLQVKKETYDITLEKLPWGFTTIKLPWMNKILTVEWN